MMLRTCCASPATVVGGTWAARLSVSAEVRSHIEGKKDRRPSISLSTFCLSRSGPAPAGQINCISKVNEEKKMTTYIANGSPTENTSGGDVVCPAGRRGGGTAIYLPEKLAEMIVSKLLREALACGGEDPVADPLGTVRADGRSVVIQEDRFDAVLFTRDQGSPVAIRDYIS